MECGTQVQTSVHESCVDMSNPKVKAGEIFYDDDGDEYSVALVDKYTGDLVESKDFYFFDGEDHSGKPVKSRELRMRIQGTEDELK